MSQNGHLGQNFPHILTALGRKTVIVHDSALIFYLHVVLLFAQENFSYGTRQIDQIF